MSNGPPLADLSGQIAVVTIPAGVPGAVLLLPFQVSVLGTPSTSVTPTNLLYNVVALSWAHLVRS